MIRRQPAASRTDPRTGPQDAGPERIYVLTGGRGGPSGPTRLDLVTLVVAVGRRRPEAPGDADTDGLYWWPSAAGRQAPTRGATTRRSLFPEHLAILRLCQCPLSAAELSAHLRLPFSATAVLIDDLLTVGLVRTLAALRSAVPEPDLIEEVLRGLQWL